MAQRCIDSDGTLNCHVIWTRGLTLCTAWHALQVITDAAGGGKLNSTWFPGGRDCLR